MAKKLVKKLLCTAPNASNNIDGIAFEPYEHGGMISVDPIDDEVKLKRLSSIRGYHVVEIEIEDANDAQNNQESKIDKKTKK